MTVLRKRKSRRKGFENAVRELADEGVIVTVTSSGSLSADPTSYKDFVTRKMFGRDYRRERKMNDREAEALRLRMKDLERKMQVLSEFVQKFQARLEELEERLEGGLV